MHLLWASDTRNVGGVRHHQSVTKNHRTGGLRLQAVTDPHELQTAAELDGRLDLVEPLIERWAKVSAVEMHPGSELALDDEYSAWRQLSHTVTGALNLAVDNLRAFRDLVRPEGNLVFPQFAHYSLLRASLEGASLALWVISPDDPKERVHRLLRAAAGELRDENGLSLQLINAMANDSDKPLSNASVDKARKQHRNRHSKHSRQLQSVATRLGIPDPTQTRWSVGYAEIVREATAAAGIKGYYGEAMWRLISGLTHPSLMRATTRSNVEEIADNEDGTFHALVTTDIGLTRMAFEASLLNATAAVNKIGERKLRRGDPTDYSTPDPR